MINKELKKINFENETFYYKVFSHVSEFGENYWTKFYFTNDVSIFKKKYWLWGPIITVPANDIAFQIDINIEGCKHTKEEIRRRLRKKIEILYRCEEIKKGNIV